MTVEELKQQIEQRTGMPAALLAGETAEEVVARAKAILAYKRKQEAQRPKSTKEQFAEWMDARTEEKNRRTANLFGLHYEPTKKDHEEEALKEIAEAYRVAAGGYPEVEDGGDPYINGEKAPDPRTAKEQFADWIGQKTAFDPFKDADGWKKLF